jgi:hypothetical protein
MDFPVASGAPTVILPTAGAGKSTGAEGPIDAQPVIQADVSAKAMSSILIFMASTPFLYQGSGS